MKKIINIIGTIGAVILTWIAPLQTVHGTDTCCASCNLKKEDDEIETVIEDTDEDDRLKY